VENTVKRTDPRVRLPNRRLHEVYRFESNGQTYVGGVGRFADGSIAEIFLNATKSGSMVEALAQDAAIVASLALQFGCPPRYAPTRDCALRRLRWPAGDASRRGGKGLTADGDRKADTSSVESL